mmetsp:Transcript_26294/g.47407  ORF Transcript_26294/g.47407 Transcript_26294/m.47407 type:complete len:181 (-) Transcript_26294:45-587(-)
MKTPGAKRVVLSLVLVLLGLRLAFAHLLASSPHHRPREDAQSHGRHDADEEGRMLGADVTKLMAAAHEGDLVHVLKLVSQGVNLDTTDDLGWTAIQFAARNGHVDVAKELIYRGCDIHKASITGRTPLMTAAGNGHESVVDVLLASGADATAKDKDGLTAYDLVRNRAGDIVVDLAFGIF